MPRGVSLITALLLTGPAIVAAQVRPEPGLVVDGKVVVRVYVTLHDDETPYYPVTHFKVRFFRSPADSVVATTDDAGTFTTLLRPGEYHVVSARDEVWKGARYSWDFSLTVKPGMAPLELREPTDPASLGAARVVRLGGRLGAPGARVEVSNGTTISTGVSPAPAQRDGFWFNVGLGIGSLGCDQCSGRETGWSGSLALGGTINPHVLYGAFVNGWTKSLDGEATTTGTVTAGLRVYPSAEGGFFFAVGLGASGIQVQPAGSGRARKTGTGAMFGLGWDLRVGNSMSITPFWSGVGIVINGQLTNFGQVGLGITWN
jgi:hypothetical protein